MSWKSRAIPTHPLGHTGPVTGSLYLLLDYDCGPGSSDGVVTDYWLDGPGSNPGGDDISRPSRPAP